MKEKRTHTTGDIAAYCGANFRTVIRWIKRGHLKAFQLPGRGDNRVTAEGFVRFLKENQMPVPEAFRPLECRVLIVDGDASLARAMSRALQRSGYEAEIAADAFQAGARVKGSAPVVMTLDLGMPGLRGMDAIRFVREQEDLSHTRILVVSAMSDEQLREAVEGGADDALAKPFDHDVLVERVGALIS